MTDSSRPPAAVKISSLHPAVAITAIVFLLTSQLVAAGMRVARIFGDNMVLQQRLANPVWGESTPGSIVRVEIAGVTAEAHTWGDGRWRALLPALPAGGPYEMTIRGPEIITFKNIMVGEVWLVSGQSNMDFRLAASTGAAADIAAADFPAIRVIRVPQQVSREPQRELGEAFWQACSPATAGSISAVGFYFARALHRQQGVAVGLVNATWSGTPAEAWTSNSALAVLPDFAEQLKAIAASQDDWRAGVKAAERIDAARDAVFEHGTAGVERGVHLKDFDDRDWLAADYPLSAATMRLPDYAIVWVRKSVELPAAAAGKGLSLNLGRCYEWDQTYFNGEPIGSHRWDGVREYRVPGRLVKGGTNTIAVRLYSEWSAGQLGKGKDQPRLFSADGTVAISLLGSWKYDGRFEPALVVPRYFQREPTSLFNGMIAPIAGYGLRGALWYQGEGNANKPRQYQSLLPALIQEWRWHWGQGDFPFLVVQLPGTVEYDWPALREAQAMATRLPKVGLVVTIDIGDPESLHPANKRPFGERLHLAARHVAYGENIVWTGPVLDRVESGSGYLRVRFKETGSGLLTRDGKAVRGFEVSGGGGGYVSARAEIDGDSVVVRTADISAPVAVRYAWAPNPDVNLVNREGLPAAPFRFEPPSSPR